MKKYRIALSLNEPELMELASLSNAVNGWPESTHELALYSCLLKVRDACFDRCNEEQRAHLDKVFAALENAFGAPSIERGMLQGALIGMVERVEAELDKLD